MELTLLLTLLFTCSVTVSLAKWSVLLTQYCAGDKIEKNEMDWECGSYGGGEGGV